MLASASHGLFADIGNTYWLLLVYAGYSIGLSPFPWIEAFLALLVGFSFIIRVPSPYKTVTESVYVTLHVVLFVTFDIVSTLLLIVPVWLFVHVTDGWELLLLGVKLKLIFSFSTTCFVDESDSATTPFCTFTLTVYFVLGKSLHPVRPSETPIVSISKSSSEV